MEYTIHPYFLKQYNRRWFLIGLTVFENGRKEHSVFPLDRIRSIEQVAGDYISPDVDLEDLFYDQIGVTLTKGEPVTVKFQFVPKRFQYVLTKPMHPSQRVVSNDDGVITIDVRPNKELYQTILSFGPDVTVLEPLEVRKKIEEDIKNMQNAYNSPE